MTKIGSLFSGAGGLDMAVENIFGGRTVWHCENDAAASKVLAHRWPDVPNHHDITTVDWTSVEHVDVMCGGWPCQPFSLAGKRKGADDERALWPYVAGAVRMVRPRIVVLENVSAVLGPEFTRVANDLAALGYDLRWICLRASDVGAPHRRERLFIVATDTQITKRRGSQRHHLGTAEIRAAEPRERFGPHAGSDDAAADTPRDGRHEGRSEPARLVGGPDAPVSGDGPVELLPTPAARDCKGHGPAGMNRNSPNMSAIVDLLATPSTPFSNVNACCLPRDIIECDTTWGKYEVAIRRWEAVTRNAPEPTIPGVAGRRRMRLNPAFSEWMMGWPAGHVTQVPDICRNDQLRIIGNGVIPQQAVAAIHWLLNLKACG